MTDDVMKRFHIEPLTTMEQFERCVVLQLEVWGYSDGDLIPRRVFLVAQRIGGQVIGAFDGETIIGFAMGLPGYRNGYAYIHSHMLAVLPQYRNMGLGKKLKLAQRDDALARGFDLMEWTFDPLEIKNAHLNIAKLGAICRRYQADFYGPSSSPLQGGLPTDRLYAEWWLKSPRVIAALHGESRAVEVQERVTVPNSIYQWKQNADERAKAQRVQGDNRKAFYDAFQRQLAVVDYERDAEGNGQFLLGPWDDSREQTRSYAAKRELPRQEDFARKDLR